MYQAESRGVILRRVAVSVIVALAFALCACGKKAPPVPPGTLRPQAIEDLSFAITPDGAVLTWTIPEKNMDGSPILRIDGFSLFRAESPVDSFCAGCPPDFRGATEIPFSIDPDNAGRMSYEDRTLQTGIVYTYEVRTRKGLLNISDPSNRIAFAWHAPPGPPEQARAFPVAGGVKITWRPPSRWTDGTGLAAPLSYVVQRKKAGSSSWKTVAEGVEGLSFYDREIDRTSLYVYRVIAVYSCAGTEIPGPESGETEPAGVFDTDAPDVPESVTAISGNRGVVIRWDVSVEPDVFGYNIYRISPGGLAIKLNARPVILNRFVDRTKLMPGKYSYSVTAVDSSANANESAMSPGATVVIR